MTFNAFWRSKWVPKTYYNTIYVQIPTYDQKNFARLTSEPKKALQKLDLGKTCYKYLHLARIEFLRFFAAVNVSLRLIIIYYILKYKFWIKTTLLESLLNPKSPLKARFRHNLLKGLNFWAKWIFKACWSSKRVPKTY